MTNDPGVHGFELPMAFNRVASREAFTPELVRLDTLIHREILRLRARYELSLDEFRGLYVSDEQVDDLVRRGHESDPDTGVARAVEAMNRLPHDLGEASGVATPWEHLRSHLDLNRLEVDLLLCTLAPELDLKYETLFAYLNNDVTRKWPTCELAARLLAGHGEERLAIRALVQPDARLMRLGLI